jgi:hypothetical protein
MPQQKAGPVQTGQSKTSCPRAAARLVCVPRQQANVAFSVAFIKAKLVALGMGFCLLVE